MEYHSTAHSLKPTPRPVLLCCTLLCCAALCSARPLARASETSHATSRRACFDSFELELDIGPPRRAVANRRRRRRRQFDSGQVESSRCIDTTNTTFAYPPSHSNSNPYRPPTNPLTHPVLLSTTWTATCNRFTSGRTFILVVFPTSSEASDPSPARIRAQSIVRYRLCAPTARGNPPTLNCNWTCRVSLVSTGKPTAKHLKVGTPGTDVAFDRSTSTQSTSGLASALFNLSPANSPPCCIADLCHSGETAAPF